MSLNPDVEYLLQSIDLDKVHEAIHATGIQTWDIDSIVARVLKACDLWLLNDFKSDKILVEQKYDNVSKGILDLILIPDKDGVCGIVDWKTTGSVKRPNFIEEIKAEFQSSLYLAHGGDWVKAVHGVRPEYIEYRALDEAGEYRTFRVNWQESCREDAEFQVDTVNLMYSALVEEDVWPRNRPKACFVGSKSGGPTCPFYKDCCNMTMPKGVSKPVDLYELRPRSKSSMKTFLTCPEQYRRTKILGAESGTSDAMEAGDAFHKAMESIYTQLLEKR